MEKPPALCRPRAPYQARPGRPAVVVGDLAELHGPTRGVVELPNRLFWQPDRRVDLDRPALLAWMYETVLREAALVDEELIDAMRRPDRLDDEVFALYGLGPAQVRSLRDRFAGWTR